MSKKILIIEDSQTVLQMLEELFQDEGYSVTAVKSGENGLSELEKQVADIIVLDTVLPGIDGFETCRQIREKYNDSAPKVLIMTGSVDAIDATKARKSGADDYCAKTSDFQEILTIVKSFG